MVMMQPDWTVELVHGGRRPAAPPSDRLARAVDELRAGRIVALAGPRGHREVGNLVAAGELTTPEVVTFMATRARGLVRLALSPRSARELRLQRQGRALIDAADGREHYLCSIEAARGVTTGISASDRAVTIQATAVGNADDLTSPGHVIPTLASVGAPGTSWRAPEAALWLCRRAHLAPLATLCHTLTEDGRGARSAEVEELASIHGLPFVTVDEIVEQAVRSTKCRDVA